MRTCLSSPFLSRRPSASAKKKSVLPQGIEALRALPASAGEKSSEVMLQVSSEPGVYSVYSIVSRCRQDPSAQDLKSCARTFGGIFVIISRQPMLLVYGRVWVSACSDSDSLSTDLCYSLICSGDCMDPAFVTNA